MAIKMNWGNALAEGLLGGIAGYAGEIGAENKQARANEQELALGKQKADSQMAVERAKMAMAKDSYDSYEATDASGNPVKTTVRNRFNPNKDNGTSTLGGYETEVMGSAPVAGKAPQIKMFPIPGDREQNFIVNPDGTQGKSVGESRAIFNTDPAMAAIAATNNRQAAQFAESEKSRSRSEEQVNTRYASTEGRRDFDAAMSKVEDDPKATSALYTKFGIDPGAANANDLLQQKFVNKYTATVGAKPVAAAQPQYDPNQVDIHAQETASGPLTEQNAPMPAAHAQANAPGSATNPIHYKPGMPKPPSGTHVIRPDGTLVVVP